NDFFRFVMRISSSGFPASIDILSPAHFLDIGFPGALRDSHPVHAGSEARTCSQTLRTIGAACLQWASEVVCLWGRQYRTAAPGYMDDVAWRISRRQDHVPVSLPHIGRQRCRTA